MSSYIKFIDTAMKTLVFTKFKDYLGLTNQTNDLVFAPKSIAMRNIAEKRGAAQIEFFSLWRKNLVFDWERQRSPVGRRGINLQYTDGNKTSIIVAKAVPVTIDYDFMVWSKDLDKVMQVAEAYLFWVHNFPNLVTTYNTLYPLELYMKFVSITDESPLEQAYEKGVYFVYNMPIRLEGWIMTSLSSRTILTVVIQVWYNEDMSTAVTSNSVLLYEDSYTAN